MARIAVRGTELEYRVEPPVAGAPWVVWGHGLTGSMAGEDRFGMVDHVHLGRHVGLLRYDARGHGESGSASDPAELVWSELGLDQVELTAALGIERYVAAGASMGCATALEAAIAVPDRVLALVLVIPPTTWETRAAQRANYTLTADLVEAGAVEQLIDGARSLPPPDPMAGVDAWFERFETTLRTTAPQRLAQVFRGAALTDLPDPTDIAAIAVPALILAWSGDDGHPVSTARRLAELLPDSELVIASTAAEVDTWTDRIIEHATRA